MTTPVAIGKEKNLLYQLMKQLFYDLEQFLFRMLTHAALDVRFLKEFISSRNLDNCSDKLLLLLDHHQRHHIHHFHYFPDHLPEVSNVNVMSKCIGQMEKKKT